MHPFAHAALPAIVVASTLGALVVCALVVAFGLAPGRDVSPRAWLLTRFGHAAAAACFAVSAVLGVVVLTQDRQERQATRAATDALDGRVTGLDGRVTTLAGQVEETTAGVGGVARRIAGVERRLDGSAGRLRDVEARVGAAEASVRSLGQRTARQLARTEAEPEPRSPVPRVVAPPPAHRPAAASAVVPPATPATAERQTRSERPATVATPPALGAPEPERVSWDTVKRDWAEAVENAREVRSDLRALLGRLGRRFGTVFGGD